LNNYNSLVDILIKDEMTGQPQHERLLLLGETPSYLIKAAGFRALPLAIQGKVICKAYFDHGITASMLKRLPDIIHNPKCVFKSANLHQADSVVVITFEIKGQAPVIIPVQKDRLIGRLEHYNLVTSVYGKEGEDPVRKWTSAGLLLWKP
jgi:hypothetical protein